MEQQKTLKEIADELMKIKGNVRGEVMRVDASFIREKEGEEGISVVEKKMEELGYPFAFKDIKPLSWYPEAQSVLVIIVAKESFDWTESDIFELGDYAPKISFLSKMFIKYFVSLERILKESPKYWKTHFDFGELEPAEINEKEKRVVIRIKGYKFHPIICAYHAAYFLRIIKSSVRGKNHSVEEIKCSHKGDSYHEYLMKWE